MKHWPYQFLLILGIIGTSSQRDEVFCSQSLLGRVGPGVISSYNYPFNYRHNLTCTYRIYMDHMRDQAKTICFNFHRFSLEATTPFCSFDYVKFSNGDTSLKYCGGGDWQFGRNRQSTYSNLWYSNFCWPVKEDHFDVVFSSDSNINSRGFYATYELYSGISPRIHQPTIISGEAPCADSQWTCANRHCISGNATCDSHRDCTDGSDESYAHARCGEQNLLACDFSAHGSLSDGMCGFTDEGGEWFRTNTAPSPYGPRGDHTNGTYGYFMYADSPHSPAYLVAQPLTLPQNKLYCLSFWYFIYGNPASASLRVYLSRTENYAAPEWSRDTTAGGLGEWRQGMVPFVTTQNTQMIFGVVIENSLSGVALDDISVMEGTCHSDDISCNFESWLCGWEAVAELGGLAADLTWEVHPSSSPVGPLHDRSSTDGSGSYLYLSYSDSWVADPRAILLSPPVSAWSGKKRCLHFSYYMSGLSQDCCILRLRHVDTNGVLQHAVWSQNGEVRGQWQEAALPMYEDRPYQIVLEGVVDHTQSGRMALDKIYIKEGECPTAGKPSACGPGEYLCTDGDCIATSATCNGVLDCQDGSDEDRRAGCHSTTISPSPTMCSHSYFRCHDDSKCIPSSWLCDTFRDCPDSSDEAPSRCGPVTELHTTPTPFFCPSTHYRCHNNRCITRAYICDDEDDCGDGSDEITKLCNMTVQCNGGEVACLSERRCIPAKYRCDGKPDCVGGEDEDSDMAGCAVAIRHSGLATSGAIGIALGALLLLIIIVLNLVLCRRRKQRRENRQNNTSSTTLAGDISTISYNEDSLQRRVQQALDGEGVEPGMEGHIYETLVEPPGDTLRLPAYTPRHLTQMRYIPEELLPSLSGPPPPLPPNPPGQHLRAPPQPPPSYPPDEPPPPYDSILKDIVVLNSSHAPTRWLQPSTAV